MVPFDIIAEMGKTVTTYRELLNGGSAKKYLFFGDILHVGTDYDEDHISVLSSSGRDVDEIKVAGAMSVWSAGGVIDAEGSTMITEGKLIGARDPTPVKEFIEKFPDIGTRRISILE